MVGAQQYNKLMKHYEDTGQIGRSAAKAGLDRKTASRYIRGAMPPPGEPRAERHWRTHVDAFEEVWEEVEGQLRRESGLFAKTLFEGLQEKYPGRFQDGQKRSFERRVRQWKELHGAEPERFFSQEHRPGERIQLDWCCIKKLGITLAGQEQALKLVHAVLPYSNWEWARVCFSESFLSLKKGLQSALFTFGLAPAVCQTDNSSTATHPRGGRPGREFNERYVTMLRHFGMKPETIAIGKAHQNGDVESLHGSLKKALEQGLMLRGSRDFADLAAFEGYLEEVLQRRNAGRSAKADEEREKMRSLPPVRLPEYDEVEVRVNREGIIRVGKQGYSVPARYIGRRLRVRVSETELAIYHGQASVDCIARRSGSQGVFVDWRHVIGELVRKPGAFERWRHRHQLFPGPRWSRYYDRLRETCSPGRANREYVHTLHLALEHGLQAVEALLDQFGPDSGLDAIRAALIPPCIPPEPDLIVDLSAYDHLLCSRQLEPEVLRHG